MIIIGGSVVNPLYTRVTVTRALIQAEIAIHSKALRNTSVSPNTSIYVHKYGVMFIDSVVQQGENIILHAYDPLAYYAKYRVVTVFNQTTKWRSDQNAVSTDVMYDFLNDQFPLSERDEMRITLNAPDISEGELVVIEARFDNVFDIYTKIPESYDPACRLDITPVASADGNTIYKPVNGSQIPKRIEAPYVIDYAQHTAYATRALVLSKDRSKKVEVGSGKLQLFVNAPLTPDADYFLEEEGLDALRAAEADSRNVTVRMLEKYLPNIKPADSILLNGNVPYTVYSIEHTTSPQGEWVYLACGGRVMSVADRINALIAADYASRL